MQYSCITSIIPMPNQCMAVDETEAFDEKLGALRLDELVIREEQILAKFTSTENMDIFPPYARAIPAENQPTANLRNTIEISLPDGETSRSFAQMTSEMARAASNNNLLHQWTAPGCEFFRSEMQRSLQQGVFQRKRNSLDLAGKLPFALKMMSLGLGAQDLWVDFSQAGGMYGTDDGMICCLREMLEVKGAKRKSGSKRQFQIKKISVDGTGWKHLFIICRSSILREIVRYLMKLNTFFFLEG